MKKKLWIFLAAGCLYGCSLPGGGNGTQTPVIQENGVQPENGFEPLPEDEPDHHGGSSEDVDAFQPNHGVQQDMESMYWLKGNMFGMSEDSPSNPEDAGGENEDEPEENSGLIGIHGLDQQDGLRQDSYFTGENAYRNAMRYGMYSAQEFAVLPFSHNGKLEGYWCYFRDQHMDDEKFKDYKSLAGDDEDESEDHDASEDEES